MPADRLKILRDGWSNTLKDPELLAEAKKRGWPVEPIRRRRAYRAGERGDRPAAGGCSAAEKTVGENRSLKDCNSGVLERWVLNFILSTPILHHSILIRRFYGGQDIAPITSAACCGLRNCCRRRSNGKVDREQLRALEDKHILRVLQRQKDLGFKIFTDGELRRLNFMSDFNDAVEGIDESDNLLRSWQAGAAGSSTHASRVPGIVVGKIKQTRPLDPA